MGLSHGLALQLGHAMALHFVVECNMTRHIVVCWVVVRHDKHDMAWCVVERRGIEASRAVMWNFMQLKLMSL